MRWCILSLHSLSCVPFSSFSFVSILSLLFVDRSLLSVHRSLLCTCVGAFIVSSLSCVLFSSFSLIFNFVSFSV